MESLTEHVVVETNWQSGTSASAGSNSGFIRTAEGIVMVDAPLVPSNAVSWRKTIAQAGDLKYLINTECHADHTLGNSFFPETVIAHALTRIDIPEHLESPDAVRRKISTNYPHCTDLVQDYQVRLPGITFQKGLTLFLGDHTIELMHLPGHTRGQIGVFIPREKVVFTGDNFSNGFQPALSYCMPHQWLDSIHRLLELDADFYVPGHGPVGNKQSVREFADFFQHCVDTVDNAISKGLAKEEIVTTIQFEGLLPPRHPGRLQQRKNVSRLYDLLVEGDRD
jgi:cyclase